MMVKFFEELEEVMFANPELFLNIQKLRHNGQWRINVFGKCLAVNDSDAELLFAEAADREEAFKVALSKIEQLKVNIANLREMKNERSNRRM